MRNRRLILVAIDRADDMRRAIRAATGMADAGGADIHVVRVVPHRVERLDDCAPWTTAQVDRCSLAADPGSPPQSGASARVQVRRVVLRGTPERVLPAYAQLTQASALIVHRDYGSPRFWRNPGVVEELARRSPVPVLVLPKRDARSEDRPRLRRVLTPVDFSIASAIALKTAVDLTRRHDARLTLVHALRETTQSLVFSGSEAWELVRRLPAQRDAVAARLRRKAASFGAGNVETAVVTGIADGAILDSAERSGADVMVIGVARRSWLDRLVFGSTLRRVLRRTRIPVLVVPVTAGAHPWPVEQIGGRGWTPSAVDRAAA
jgi:nucleotide-binding universal stress UspA family protein